MSDTAPSSASAPVRERRLLDIRRIYAEPAALELPRGQEVVARWPGAEIVPVESHWLIPEVHGDEANVARWVRIKTEALVVGVIRNRSQRSRTLSLIIASTEQSLFSPMS